MLVSMPALVGPARSSAHMPAGEDQTTSSEPLPFTSSMLTVVVSSEPAGRGKVVADGPTTQVVASYLNAVQGERYRADLSTGAVLGDQLDITGVTLHDAHGSPVDEVTPGRPLTVRFHYRAHEPVASPAFSVGISDVRTGVFAVASMLADARSVPPMLEGEGHVDCTFSTLPLHSRTYDLWASIRGGQGFGDLLTWQRLRSMSVVAEVRALGAGAATVTTEAPVALDHANRMSGIGLLEQEGQIEAGGSAADAKHAHGRCVSLYVTARGAGRDGQLIFLMSIS